ncbi:hypothetical protein B0H11DRAFT_1901393 [Mycena galericulata]|nr:hypothetical protein B0H11DRAFT_1901393 [Mycena galericulata]
MKGEGEGGPTDSVSGGENAERVQAGRRGEKDSAMTPRHRRGLGQPGSHNGQQASCGRQWVIGPGKLLQRIVRKNRQIWPKKAIIGQGWSPAPRGAKALWEDVRQVCGTKVTQNRKFKVRVSGLHETSYGGGKVANLEKKFSIAGEFVGSRRSEGAEYAYHPETAEKLVKVHRSRNTLWEAAFLLLKPSQMMSASTPLDFSLAPEEAVSLLDEISKLRSFLGPSSGLESSPTLPGLADFEKQLRHRVLQHPASGLRLVSRPPSPLPQEGFFLPSFLLPSLSHLTTTPPASVLTPPSPSSVLGKRITVTRPESFDSNEAPLKKSFTGIKWRIPVLSPVVGSSVPGSLHDSDSVSSSSAEESAGEEELPAASTRTQQRKAASGAKRKRPDRRNATFVGVGSDADIGYVGSRAPIGSANILQTHNGYRLKGTGPPVTLAAGNPAKGLVPLSGQTDMKSLIADLISLETDAHANDLLYMCKLVQLVLNVDQFRRDWKNEGKGERTPGVASIAESYGLESTCLGLRTTLTEAYHDAVKDINSLADAIREVSDSEGKWRPLVLRLIAAIQYLQNTSIPVLDNYRFVRGEDTFTFVDVNKADEVLQSVQTCLFKLPVRAPDWNEAVSKPWASRLSSNEAIQPAEVVVIRTGLKLERTSSLPFENGKEKSWTEQERGYAEQAAIPTSFEDFKAQCSYSTSKILDLHKSGKCPRGKYIDLDSDILDGGRYGNESTHSYDHAQ